MFICNNKCFFFAFKINPSHSKYYMTIFLKVTLKTNDLSSDFSPKKDEKSINYQNLKSQQQKLDLQISQDFVRIILAFEFKLSVLIREPEMHCSLQKTPLVSKILS